MTVRTSKRGPSPSATLQHLQNQIREQIAERVREVVYRLVQECFTQQRDPDGTSWPARADGSGEPLLMTLAPDIEVYSDGDSVVVPLEVGGRPHAIYQFAGTRTIPSRRWAPAPGEPLPPAWQERVDSSVRQFIAEAWRASR